MVPAGKNAKIAPAGWNQAEGHCIDGVHGREGKKGKGTK